MICNPPTFPTNFQFDVTAHGGEEVKIISVAPPAPGAVTPRYFIEYANGYQTCVSESWITQQVDNAERQGEFSDTLAAIAEELSAAETDLITKKTWFVKELIYDFGGILHCVEDGRSICVRKEGERAEVTGYYPGPQDGNEYLSYDAWQKPPKVTAALSQGPKRIAKGIVSRFMPKFLPILEKAIRTKQKNDAYLVAKAEMQQVICEAFGRDAPDSDGEIRFEFPRNGHRGPWGQVQGFHSTDGARSTVSVKINSMSLEQAQQIAEILKG
jgi:hypothetical protein